MGNSSHHERPVSRQQFDLARLRASKGQIVSKPERIIVFGGDRMPFGDMAPRTQEQIDWDEAWKEVNEIAPGLRN